MKPETLRTKAEQAAWEFAQKVAEEIRQLTEERNTLREQLKESDAKGKAARADAERWNYCRKHADNLKGRWYLPHFPSSIDLDAAIDAAIDAAMKGSR